VHTASTAATSHEAFRGVSGEKNDNRNPGGKCFYPPRCGRTAIAADVRKGSRRDAILYAVGANEGHGLRRTPADKRKAVLTLLEDPEWSKWSSNAIAKACKVGHRFVDDMRRSLAPEQVRPSRQTSQPPPPATLADYEAEFTRPEPDDTDDADDPPESGGESEERVYRNRYGEVGTPPASRPLRPPFG
jgi:hypothetical protein